MKIVSKLIKRGDKAIVINGWKGDKEVASSLVLHTAHLVADNIETVDSSNITQLDKILYICGHGDLEKQTIGGRKISSIAKLLVDNGYDGTQDIYITSCDSNTKTAIELDDERIDLEDTFITLAEYLKILLYVEVTEDFKLGFKGRQDFKVIGLADGASVTVADNNETILYVIKAETKADKAIMMTQQLKQSFIDKQIGIDKDLSNYSEGLHYKMAAYRNRLIAKEYKSVEFESSINILTFILGFVVALATLLIQLISGVFLDYTLSVTLGAIMLLIIDMLHRIMLRKGGKDSLYGSAFGYLMVLSVVKFEIIIYIIFYGVVLKILA